MTDDHRFGRTTTVYKFSQAPPHDGAEVPDRRGEMRPGHRGIDSGGTPRNEVIQDMVKRTFSVLDGGTLLIPSLITSQAGGYSPLFYPFLPPVFYRSSWFPTPLFGQ